MHAENHTSGIQRKWYRLDNAANLYPAIRGKKRPGVFRLSVELTERIQPNVLQNALNRTLKRFPIFSVKLRAGLFWHYFVHTDAPLLIQTDVSNPCMEISRSENNGYLMRVRYHHSTIAVEFFHSLTDGAGAIKFLKTLTAQYLIALGHPIPSSQGVLDCNQTPPPEESHDSFQPFVGDIKPQKRQAIRAYHIKGTQLAPHTLHTITGIIPIDKLSQESKKLGVSITEYVTAVYLFTISRIQLTEETHRKLPIRIQVPVDLRRFFESDTLRNFSAFVIPTIDPMHGEYTFEEILILVHHFLRFEVTGKRLRTQVAANLNSASNLLVRVLPLFIKNRLINMVYKFIGPSVFTSTISNLGVIKIPLEMEKHVKGFGFVLGASQDTNVSCSMHGYGENIHICFSRVIQETIIEKEFFTFFIRAGIPVLVESNQE